MKRSGMRYRPAAIGCLLAAFIMAPAAGAATAQQVQAGPPGPGPGGGPQQRDEDDWDYRMGPGMMGGYGYGYGYGGRGQGMMGGYGYGGRGPGMMGGYGGGPGMMGGQCGWFAGAVDLTRDQETKVNRICDDLRRKHWELAGRMMTESERLRDLSNAEKRDPATIGQQFAKVQAIQRQMLEQSIDAENRVEAVLTPEQLARERQTQRWGPGRRGSGR